MALKFNPVTGQLDIAGGGTTITNGADNVIVRFDGTDALQGYTSNAPTISDDGTPHFGLDAHANSMRIGAGSTVGNVDTTVIGVNAQGNGRRACVYGYLAVGNELYSTTFGAVANSKNTGCAFGFAALAGSGCMAFGPFTNNFFYRFSTAVGVYATNTADNQLVFGGDGPYRMNEGYIGAGVSSATAYDFSLRGTNASGTNASPGDFYFKAGAGTGTGNGGRLFFQVAPAATTGSTLNSYVTSFQVEQSGEFKNNYSVSKPIATVSTNTTLDTSHYTVLIDTSGGDVTVTLPAVSGITGRIYNIKKKTSDSNKVIIDGNGSEKIDGGLTAEITVQYESITIQCDGTEWFVL